MKIKSLFIITVTILLSSCGKNNLEKHLAEFNECVEKKKEEKKYKYSNIQEALNAYDFEAARDYLACHPSRNEIVFSELNEKWWKGYRTHYRKPYQDDLELIVRSEITYFVSQGEFQKAEMTAKESNMVKTYKKISGAGFQQKLEEMIERKEFKKIYTFLSNKRLEYKKLEFRLDQSPSNNYNASDDGDILFYNDEIRTFNAFLDEVLELYKYEKIDKNELSSLIDLALPELVEKKNGRGSMLSDIFKKEATAKYLK
jgi:hypothetical protein